MDKAQRMAQIVVKNDPELTLEALDPENSRKVRNMYDFDFGYVAHLRAAALSYDHHNWLQQPPNPWEGAILCDVLSNTDCRELTLKIAQNSPELMDKKYRFSLLSTILNPTVDRHLRSYFGSYYFPLFMRFYRNNPNEIQGKPSLPLSFHWHCDAGPTAHLKMLLYLNSVHESGGNTEFLPKEASKCFEEVGYTFNSLDLRLTDLSPIAERYNIPYQPVKFPLNAGEAVLFEPANVLHRGIWPTKAPRFFIQLCFLPSKIPWKMVCEASNYPSSDNGWPKGPQLP